MHPPPPQPVRLPPTVESEEECSKGRNDVEGDIAQADSGDTLQDGSIATNRLEEYCQMEEVIYALRDEVQDLQHHWGTPPKTGHTPTF